MPKFLLHRRAVPTTGIRMKARVPVWRCVQRPKGNPVYACICVLPSNGPAHVCEAIRLSQGVRACPCVSVCVCFCVSVHVCVCMCVCVCVCVYFLRAGVARRVCSSACKGSCTVASWVFRSSCRCCTLCHVWQHTTPLCSGCRDGAGPLSRTCNRWVCYMIQ